jgi:hypothetical protein
MKKVGGRLARTFAINVVQAQIPFLCQYQSAPQVLAGLLAIKLGLPTKVLLVVLLFL